jgi:hypothetical protein
MFSKTDLSYFFFQLLWRAILATSLNFNCIGSFREQSFSPTTTLSLHKVIWKDNSLYLTTNNMYYVTPSLQKVI